MPAFYAAPKTINDLVDFIVGKVLDAIGLEHELFKRYG
jgi:4-hydroxy-3-polyprenylbenzoate decarboxylase